MSYRLMVTNLVKDYSSRSNGTVLDGVSFTAQPGAVVSIIGRNGAGKSTLMKIIAGLQRPDRGSVTVSGTVGYLPEQPSWPPALSVWQWLVLTGGMNNLSAAAARGRAAELCHEVGLDKVRRQSIGTLSKGQRQRLGFATAALGRPDLLLLDEPLDGLDPFGRRDLKTMIAAAAERGATVLLCSHILSDIAELSDRLGVLEHGRLRFFGATNEFPGGDNLEKGFIDFLK